MRQMDRILQIIREHPEGITTPELADMIYPGSRIDRNCLYALISTKCMSLLRYDLISRTTERRINAIGRPAMMSIWKAV